ncbi:MAG TPA: glycoside hydrolase domain-containing protein [Longimicrobium sp.]|nr:glycoside hydrolase domain-containing protein [Longimicrobium sp.]
MIQRTAIRRAARASAFLLAAMTAAACASTGGGGRITLPGPGPRAAAGFAGFDTGIYPGDAAMRAWRQTSPYQWVGYYLAAPCHRDASWSGKREALVGMGWGTAVIYLGQQDWAAAPNRAPAPDTARADSTAQPQQPAAVASAPPACSAANLSAARGTTDAADAVAKTAAEGFPAGTVIYLDVERVTAVSPALSDYVRGWVDGVLAEGRYTPGIYVHRLNADAVATAARAAYTARGRVGDPQFWVTASTGFSLELPPTASGVPYASVWQGPLDLRETWGGYTLQVDVNVATTRSPSAPGQGTP